LTASGPGDDPAEPSPPSLPVRLLHIAAVAVMLAVGADRAAPRPGVMNSDRQGHVIPVAVVIGVIAVARTPLLAFGAGVVIGGGLGNMGELAIFGRVTDFIPLGIPFRGAVWSPADLFLAAGPRPALDRRRAIPSDACTTSA
jgi:hypothetical protein